MARSNPVRTAQAVVDIDQVWFAKHSAFGGSEPVIDDALLADAGQTQYFKSIATLRSSVTVQQDDLSLTKILIDQTSAPIGISTEAGDFNISFDMPDLKSANLVDWFDDHTAIGSEIKDNNGIAAVQGLGYTPTEQLNSRVMILVTRTGQTLVFPNVQGACTLTKGENEVWLAHFQGQVLAPANAANKTMYLLTDAQQA